MTRLLPALLMLAAIEVAAGCASVPEPRHETDALDRVIPIALVALDGSRKGDGPYRLIGAQQLPLDGRWVWRVTFKAKKHLPTDLARDMLTAGGEIFVNVDEVTGETTVGYGE